MCLHRLILVLFCSLSFTVWSQNDAWQHDTSWVSTGWASADIGWWEDVRDLCPWGADAGASAIQVYAAEGGSHPAIIRMTLDSEMHILFPFEEDVERPIQIEKIASDTANRLWCAMNQQSHDSTLTSLGGLWVLDPEGQPDNAFGSDSLPGWIPITFGGPFQELHGLNGTSDGQWMVSGMALDPCCFHREMPTLALLDADGQWVNSFGNNGRLILDVGAAEILDTLGMRPALNRHEIGGFYSSAVATDGGWIAGGAYSNATHYEVLVVKHTSDGTLDSTFGDNGIVHLNLNPGVNHWVSDVRIESNGLISVNVVSHAAGDLPTGWHALILDATGTPLQWETTESNATWTSLGFLDTSDSWPLGFGFEEGASNPSLISYDGDLEDAPEMILLEPLLSPEGSWGEFRAEYHPAWDRLMIAGHWQGPTNGSDPNPQILISLWEQDLSTALHNRPHRSNKSNPYPNPIQAGEALHIEQISGLMGGSGEWSLASLSGVEVWRWHMLPGMKTLMIDPAIPSGAYILKSPFQPAQRFQLIVE